MDLVLFANGTRALTTNATSNTVSLVDVEQGKILAEVAVGKRPFCAALSRDGKTAVVTNCDADTVSLLTVGPAALHVTATLAIGDEPRGVAMAPDGSRAYVALAGEDRLVAVDMKERKAGAKVEVGIEPWHVALTSDGTKIAVGNSRSQDMTILSAPTLKLLHTVKLRGRNVRHIAISADNAWAYVPHISERGRPATKENIDLGWIIGNRLSRCPLGEEGPREAIALDPRGKAVGDVDGVDISPDGTQIALTAGGTHELLLLRLPLPFMAYGGPGDHIEKELLNNADRFRRIPLGGRPLGVHFTPDGKSVVVANYLSNSLQVVEVGTGQVARTISVGGTAAPSQARLGEAIFYDASRSFNQWYSCHSCHTEGHTNGSNFDTFNDGSYNSPKKTLSLRGVSQTAPYTWHGWQKSLRQLVHDSMTKSMQGPEPTDEDLDALVAFVSTLEFRRNPTHNTDGSLSPAAKRGEAVFLSRACNTCHTPPLYTSSNAYTVGLESEQDAYKGFNPPSLRGVYNRAPYLHQGQAQTLEEVLTQYHLPSKLNGKPDVSGKELDDLIAFLNSL